MGDCCASCQATPSCNAWQYCSQKGGCRTPNTPAQPYGACRLLRSAEVAAGQASYSDWSALTVPFISGYTVAAGQAPTAPTTAQPAVPVAPTTNATLPAMQAALTAAEPVVRAAGAP